MSLSPGDNYVRETVTPMSDQETELVSHSRRWRISNYWTPKVREPHHYQGRRS